MRDGAYPRQVIDVAGDSAARRFIFDGYVAGPGLAAAYEQASARKPEGRTPIRE